MLFVEMLNVSFPVLDIGGVFSFFKLSLFVEVAEFGQFNNEEIEEVVGVVAGIVVTGGLGDVNGEVVDIFSEKEREKKKGKKRKREKKKRREETSKKKRGTIKKRRSKK